MERFSVVLEMEESPRELKTEGNDNGSRTLRVQDVDYLSDLTAFRTQQTQPSSVLFQKINKCFAFTRKDDQNI